MNRFKFNLTATLLAAIVAAHPLTTFAQSNQRPLDNRSSVERDKYLLGISQAVKSSDHTEALRLIDRLERSGVKVPAPVLYFKAESMLALSRYAEALTASDLYLAQGPSARYYEEALRVSLAADKGLEGVRKAWQNGINDLQRELSGAHAIGDGWTKEGYFNDDYKVYKCRISGPTVKLDAKVDGNILVIRRVALEQQGRGGCINQRNTRETVSVGSLNVRDEFIDGYTEIDLKDISRLKIEWTYAKCEKRWKDQFCNSAKYHVLVLPDGKRRALGYIGSNIEATLATLRSLYADNRAVVFR